MTILNKEIKVNISQKNKEILKLVFGVVCFLVGIRMLYPQVRHDGLISMSFFAIGPLFLLIFGFLFSIKSFRNLKNPMRVVNVDFLDKATSVMGVLASIGMFFVVGLFLMLLFIAYISFPH